MTLAVTAPLPGALVALEEVPDPVFAGKFVGPGIAIDPPRGEEITAVAPVGGKVAKVHAHAFVVVAPSGQGVLVHLGLDTVQLAGQGFTVHAKEGAQVQAGDPMVTWSPAEIESGGRNPVVPVIVLESEESGLVLAEAGASVQTGQTIITVK